MRVTETFFQGFTILTSENNGLYSATAISNQASIAAVYGLSNGEVIQVCKLQILKYLASTNRQPCVIAQDSYVLYLNKSAQLALKTKQTVGLSIEKVLFKLLHRNSSIQVVGLLESPPMRMITFKKRRNCQKG